MPAARIIKRVVNRSNYVPASSGVAGYLVLDALRGPSEPVLVTTQREFLDTFTVNGELSRNLDDGYFSAIAYLQKSNQLYVRRVNGAGVEFAQLGGAGTTATAGTLTGTSVTEATVVATLGATPVTDGEFDITVDGVVQNVTGVDFTGDTSGADLAATLEAAITGVTIAWDSVNNWFLVTSATTGATSAISNLTDPGGVGTFVGTDLGLVAGTAVPGNPAVAGSGDPALLDLQNLDSAAARLITSTATVDVVTRHVQVGTVDDLSLPLVDDELYTRTVSIFAADGGAWANGWSVSVELTALDSGYEPARAYTISVNNAEGELIESFLVSFDPNKTDNFGQNIYFADVLKTSKTILVTASDEVQSAAASLAEITTPTIPYTTIFSGGVDATGPMLPADAISALDDGDGLDIRLWLNGGYTNVSFQKALVAKAEEDCKSFAFLTVPKDVDATGDTTQINTWISDTLNVNSTQAFAPIVGWLEVATLGGGTRFVSPDGYVAGNFSQVMTNKNFWDIVAGFDNGVISAPISVSTRYNQAKLDVLVDGGANPIASFPGEGIVLWGQRTATMFPSALDRANVSLLLMFITIQAEAFLRPFLHRANTEQTRDEIRTGLILFGDNIKANAGVFDYRVEVEATPQDIDNYCATVRFYVEPVKGIEKLILEQIVVNTGELS